MADWDRDRERPIGHAEADSVPLGEDEHLVRVHLGDHPDDLTCCSCAHWQGMDARLGQCRRHPPVIDQFRAATSCVGLFPLTQDHDWCGEHSGLAERLTVSGDPSVTVTVTLPEPQR